MIDNRFELRQKIGASHKHDVFWVQDYLFCDYAVKILKKQAISNHQAALVELQQQAYTIDDLEGHPNILGSFGIYPNGAYQRGNVELGICYSVHELPINGSLSGFIFSNGKLPEETARLYTYQLFSALEHIHSRGYAHTRISLTRIFLDQDFNAKLGGVVSCINLAKNRTKSTLPIKRDSQNCLSSPEETTDNDDDVCLIKADIQRLAACILCMLTGKNGTNELLQELSDYYQFAIGAIEDTKGDTTKFADLSLEV